MVDTLEPAPRSAALRALAERGFVEQVSDVQAVDDALNEGMVTFYVGFDPTARSLHAGHLMCVMAMRLLQKFGHRPIGLVGGGTARVGDPSGRAETRGLMDEPTIDANVAGIGAQLRQMLSFAPEAPNAAVFVDNAKWLVGQRYLDFLREVGVHFTVNRMIATKTYRERLENELPLSFLEFNYQLLQAYDFLHLYREHNCTMQLGGSDQWGNMVAGVELIRRITGHDNGVAQCLTWPLLTMSDGRKMGKSERGAVWLDPEQVSPFDYFQYWISCDDRDVKKLLLRFTDVPVPEIEELCRAEGAALRDVKHKLATEATRILHGEEAAEQSQAAARQAFGAGEDWSAVPAITFPATPIRLVDLLVDARIKAFESKRQARERVASGAVKLDGRAVTDPAYEVSPADVPDDGLRLQAGRRTRFRIVMA